MRKKILILINTEYHLLLATQQIFHEYNSRESFDVHAIFKKSDRTDKMQKSIKLETLPITYEFWDHAFPLKSPLSIDNRKKIDDLIQQGFDTLIFFQEQDVLSVILSQEMSKRGTKIYLFQDGLKPYGRLKFISPSMVFYQFRLRQWVKRNGYDTESMQTIWTCKRYGYLDKIDRLFLTFPESFSNWRRKPLARINLNLTSQFKDVLKDLYSWGSNELPETNGVIFYINQPIGDGQYEVTLLMKLRERFADATFYIKLHPLTRKEVVAKYREEGFQIIESSIPAELYVSELSNSLVLSFYSTALLVDNPSCRFYWLHRIARNNIPKIGRFEIANPTKHIKVVDSIEEIKMPAFRSEDHTVRSFNP